MPDPTAATWTAMGQHMFGSQENDMSETTMFPIGSICIWVVGMPGPDLDQFLVIGHTDDGKHIGRFKAMGIGQWHEQSISRCWLAKYEMKCDYVLFNPLDTPPDGNITEMLRRERERLGLPRPEGSL